MSMVVLLCDVLGVLLSVGVGMVCIGFVELMMCW